MFDWVVLVPSPCRHHGNERSSMWLGVLGPVRCVVGGRTVEVTRRPDRAVLEAMAVARDRVAGIDELLDALWGDDPPEFRAHR